MIGSKGSRGQVTRSEASALNDRGFNAKSQKLGYYEAIYISDQKRADNLY